MLDYSTATLSQIISIFGIPKVIQSHKGRTLHQRWHLGLWLHIKHGWSTLYHEESQGTLEQFHQTLKTLLRAYPASLAGNRIASCAKSPGVDPTPCSHLSFPSLIFQLHIWLLTRFQIKIVISKNYDRRKKIQLFNVNLLKPYYSRLSSALGDANPVTAVDDIERTFPATAMMSQDMYRHDDGVLQCQFKNWVSKKCRCKIGLSDSERQELNTLILSFPLLFSDIPSVTHLIEHDLDVGDAKPVQQHFYSRKTIWNEVHVGP